MDGVSNPPSSTVSTSASSAVSSTLSADLEAAAALDLDPDVRPQDDLFRHVNGRWLERTTIPADRASHGVFYLLRDQSEAQVRTIVEEAAAAETEPGSEQQKIGDLYTSFMAEETVDALDARPLQPVLARVADVADREQLLRLVGELQRSGLAGLFSSYVWIDKGDPTRYLLYVSQGGLGLPDEAYYREDSHAATREAYVGHVARMLTLAGVTGAGEADALAASVMDLETRMAAAHWDTVATRDAVKTYNLLPGDDVEGLLPGWSVWTDAAGIPDVGLGEVVVGEPDVLRSLDTLLDEVPMASWRAWLAWHVVHSTAPYLSADLVAENFDFYGRTLTGAAQLRERWKRGVGLVEGVLGEAVGKLYVERHYPPVAHEGMTLLVDNVVAAYADRIRSLSWMGPDTRERALAKLEAFTPKIGRPVRWRDYSALEVRPDDLFGNVMRATAFEHDRDLARLGAPIDRDEWFMTPQTVNAYYNPAMNEIVFPASILQPPFFDLGADDAYNYGSIGAVIGHEIGHGFDDQGSRYDGSGALSDWWTEDDRARFEEQTAALVAQYGGFHPVAAPEHHVNGAFTLGENIGDLGGVEVALHAYLRSLGGEEPPVVDGLTGVQRFFLGYARSWRGKARPEEVVRRIAIDPHSPDEFRANVVRNVDAFHEAFGTEPGDGLWVQPQERVRIW